MKCQYADRTVRPYSSWVSTAVVLLTAFVSELESTQAFAPDSASSIHNGLEHQQKQQQQRPPRSSLPAPYTFSDELSSSSSSRRNGGISNSLDVGSFSLPSSPMSIYTDGSISPTSQMLQELERSFSLGSNHADLTNFPSHSRAVDTGSKRNRLSKMIRPKSLSSSPRLEGGTGATQNASATIGGSSSLRGAASLLTREEEGNLVSNIRRMRKVVRVRDELIARLAAAASAATHQQQTQSVSESEWAQACGLAPKQLRRVMYDGQEARSIVVSANAGLVTSIAKRHYQALKQATAYGGGVGTILTLHDMIQEGNLGIMEAAERFEPERGLRFSTYATYWIRQRILRSISDSSRIIRLPAYVHSILKKISSAKKEMYQQIGRIPSTQELAKYLEMTEEKVLQYSSTSRSVVSLELPMRNSDTIKEDRRTIGDYIASDAPTPEEHAQGQNLKQEIRAVVNGLAAKERDVLVYRFGLDNGEPMTVDQTASRLGISRDRVRLVEARAINKLRSPQRNYRLKEYVSGDQNQHHPHHPSHHYQQYDSSTGGEDDRLPRSNAPSAEDESKKASPPRMTPERLWSF